MYNSNLINPGFISGFIDAEGCFHISVVEHKNLKIGYSVRVIFQISLHEKDKALLDSIKDYFGVGKVIARKDGVYYYQVTQIKDLILILDHLAKYPLITQKRIDCELFKQVVYLMIEQKHLTKEGLAKIVNIKAAMNFKVLSDKLLSNFSDVKPVERPVVKDIEIYDVNWVSGFVEGEGCFFVNIYKRKESVLGEGVKLVFKITQDKRNNEVLALFSSIFGCGKIYNQSASSKGGSQDFMVTGLGDITEKVIPFFLAHPLLGAKLKEFQDWCKVAELMQNKDHLTKDGLEKIRSIKLGMNFNRVQREDD